MTENTYLAHHGIKGMKWGVRRTPEQLGHNPTDTAVTRRVKNDYNTMTDAEFRRKYSGSKRGYAKKVAKSQTGDPFKDRREKMQRSKLGSKAFDINAKAESNQRVSEQLGRKAAKVNANRSTNSRALTTLFLGSKGNMAYDKLRATGATKRGSAAVIALFGTQGASEYAEAKYRQSSQGKRTYTKSLNKYYQD